LSSHDFQRHRAPEQLLALAMARHPRLGQHSPAKMLTSSALRVLGAFLREPFLFVIGGMRLQGYSSNPPVMDTELYNWSAGSWETGAAPLRTPRAFFGAVALRGGCAFRLAIVIAGGQQGGNLFFPEDVLASCEAYDPVGNQWQGLPSLCTARARCSLVESGGRLFCVGGCTAAGPLGDRSWQRERPRALTSCEMLELPPAAGVGKASDMIWREVAPMRRGRVHTSACTLGSFIYALGSGWQDQGDDCSPSLEVYDPSQDVWTELECPWGSSLDASVDDWSIGRISFVPMLGLPHITPDIAGVLVTFGGWQHQPCGTCSGATDASKGLCVSGPCQGQAWRAARRLDVNRFGAAVATVGQNIIICGGCTGTEFGGLPSLTSASVCPAQIYRQSWQGDAEQHLAPERAEASSGEPDQVTWQYVKNMQFARYGHAAVVVDL